MPSASGICRPPASSTSYNTYPQGHLRGATRRILRHAHGDVAAAGRYLATVHEHATDPLWTSILASEIERLRHRDDDLTYHDELGPAYHCLSVADSLERAAAFGLQFLGQARPAALLRPAHSREALAQPVEIACQQALDLTTFQGFRRTLLCRDHLPVERDRFARHLPKLRLASPLRFAWPADGGGQLFRNERGAGQVALHHPALLTMLHRLAQIRPQAHPPAALRPADPLLTEQLLTLAAASLLHARHVDLRVAHPPGPFPLASPLARLQAAAGPLLTTLLHTQVQFEQASAREFLEQLDGTRPAGSSVPLHSDSAQSRQKK